MARRAAEPLTDRTVKGLKATGKNYRKRDGHTPGLAVAVTARGSKSWEYWYASPESGKRRPVVLGRYPDLSLASAREAVPPIRLQVKQGIDPIEEEKRQRARKALEDAGTFGALLAVYRKKLVDEGSEAYAKKVGEDITRNIPIEVQAKPASALTSATLVDLMQCITARAQTRGYKGHRCADYLRTYVNAAYEFAITAQHSKWKNDVAPFAHLQHNPAQRIKKFQDEPSVSDRNLSSDEVKRLWHSVGVEAMSLDLAYYIKLSLALGGQRVEELLHAKWSEFDEAERTWSIPIERRKIRKKARHREPHLVYLTDLTLNLLQGLRALTGETPYLFPNYTGQKPRTVWAIDKAITRYCTPGPNSMRKAFVHFTPKDLRRTVKTLMGQATLSKEIRDRVQGHAFRDIASVHYDRYQYWAEKQAAMEHWCQWLETLLLDVPYDSNVVQLRV